MGELTSTLCGDKLGVRRLLRRGGWAAHREQGQTLALLRFCRGPSSIPGCAFAFPTSSKCSLCTCPIPRSHGGFISPFLVPGFALNIQPGRLCHWIFFFFFLKQFRIFFLDLSKATQSTFDQPPIQTPPPCCHHHQNSSGVSFIPLTDKCSQQSQALEY